MSLRSELVSRSGEWTLRAPASTKALASLRASVGFELPAAYLDLLRVSNGGEGDLAADPYWVELFTTEEVMPASEQLNTQELAPGFLCIGTAGVELVALDLRHATPCPVVILPDPPDPAKLRPLADNFEAFIGLLGIEGAG